MNFNSALRWSNFDLARSAFVVFLLIILVERLLLCRGSDVSDQVYLTESAAYPRIANFFSYFSPRRYALSYRSCRKKMLVPPVWVLWALYWATTVISQGVDYQFTMSVTTSSVVPGKPFMLTWSGGEPTDVVYIILNYYFPDTPNQNIVYITTDILCKYIILMSILHPD
jgi:hypothetical protein